MHGKHLREVLGEEAWISVRPHVERALAGEVVTYDTEIANPMGGRRWISVTYTPDFGPGGEVRGFVVLVVDITARKQAEDQLRASEKRFVRFMRHLPGLAWIKDLEGRYVFANESAMRAFQRSKEDLYGKTDDEIFPPETAARFRENDRLALVSEAGIMTVETLEHDDSTLHHSIVSKFPILGQDGKPVMIGGMAIDITERKRQEEALREADRRKDEFLATLAHELRNPLAPIRNAAQLLQLDNLPPREFQAAREIIDRQLAQMVRLVDDLLDVSRITRNKLQLRREPIELAAAIQSAIETSRPVIEEAGHRLIVDLPDEPLCLEADLTRLAQVFVNLLNNAAKYTDHGGEIRLSIRRDGSDAVISVRDTGIGILPEQLPRIFEMFSQVTPALDRTQGGLGIGLSLVRGLVEMHGGTIEAHSEGAGRGSEFLVRLPLGTDGLSCPLPPALSNFAPASGEIPHKCRILVVDDNLDAANSLAIMLRLLGHELITAHDGLQAVQAAADFEPDVVLLDIGLPKMNGYEAARRIRLSPCGQRMLLVALTGWGQEDDKRRAREAGFDHHLTKPVESEVLERLIASVKTRNVETPQV
jgi:PAS domain S-box-containing protein